MNNKIIIKGAREHPAPKQALRLRACALALAAGACLVTGQATSKYE